MNPAIRLETVGQVGSPHRIRIAHLSDFHLWFSSEKLRRLEPLIAAWQPDVLALTGDYADTPVGRRLAVEWIGRMAAAYPLCWVAGNHDRWWGRSFLEKLESLELAHPIDRRDAWITTKSGCRYRFTSWERLIAPRSAGASSGPSIALLHDPAVIKPEKLPDDGDCLLLAGHLHGGQITLWRDGRGRPQPATFCYPWLGDRRTVGRVPLVVSRGLGDTLPIRVRAPREMIMVDFSARGEGGRPQRQMHPAEAGALPALAAG